MLESRNDNVLQQPGRTETTGDMTEQQSGEKMENELRVNVASCIEDRVLYQFILQRESLRVPCTYLVPVVV